MVGPLYTALYPIWPFFIAAVTGTAELRDMLFNRVREITMREKSVRKQSLETDGYGMHQTDEKF